MKFLYIVSSPHGGSTLLSHLLGRNPAAVSLGEVAFIPKLLALGEPCTCGKPLAECEHWARLFDALAAACGTDLRETPYGLFLGDAIKGQFGSGLVDEAYQTQWRRSVAKLRGAVDTVALLSAPNAGALAVLTPPAVRAGIRNTLALYATAAQAFGRELVIDASKLPRKAPQLFVACPERVRILHLVRDGRGVLASRLRYMSARRAVRRWNHYHRLSRYLLRRWVSPESYRRLRYEDFVAAPEEQLRALCDWLEMAWSPAMLDPAAHRIEHSAGGNPARFRLAEGIRPDERWRTQLNDRQLAMFEHTAGALNRELGYGR